MIAWLNRVLHRGQPANFRARRTRGSSNFGPRKFVGGRTWMAAALVGGLCLLPASAQSITPETSEGHPDLTGVWNGVIANPRAPSDDPLASNLPSRDGNLANYERDNALIRRADPNKPLYKPEFWEKVQQLDQNENTADPSFGCMPAGVPRMGPPDKIVQT